MSLWKGAMFHQWRRYSRCIYVDFPLSKTTIAYRPKSSWKGPSTSRLESGFFHRKSNALQSLAGCHSGIVSNLCIRAENASTLGKVKEMQDFINNSDTRYDITNNKLNDDEASLADCTTNTALNNSTVRFNENSTAIMSRNGDPLENNALKSTSNILMNSDDASSCSEDEVVSVGNIYNKLPNVPLGDKFDISEPNNDLDLPNVPLGDNLDISEPLLVDNRDIIDCSVANDYPDVPLDGKFILPTNWRGINQFKEGIKFTGEVYVIKELADEQRYKDILDEFAGKEALGFDSEHCSGQGVVCVIQLATEDKAVLWQSYNFNGTLPPRLKSLLMGNVYKTGHACLQDAIMISNQFSVHSKNLIDTCYWARDLSCLPRSLQAMCAIFLGEHLSKRHQQSNWKKDTLTPGQISYAATDAWISLRVYQEMKKHAERLGVELTPCYRSLQHYTAEVKNSRRLKRLRYKRRLKEQKQMMKTSMSEFEDSKEKTKQTIVAEDQSVESTNDDIIGALKANKHDTQDIKVAQTQSSGSRKRNRKFYAKFHVLE